MRQPQQTHHIFFPAGNTINPRGILRWGATEITIYHKQGVKLELPEAIDKHTSVHRIELEFSLTDASEHVQEDLEDLLVEEMLVCVNLDDSNPLVAHVGLNALYQNRLAFQARARPCLGPYTTVMYYNTPRDVLSYLPLIPARPELCGVIYRILSRKKEAMDKDAIKEGVQNIMADITKDQVDNALVILENWLALFPGFTAKQKKQRKKEYQIKEYTE